MLNPSLDIFQQDLIFSTLCNLWFKKADLIVMRDQYRLGGQQQTQLKFRNPPSLAGSEKSEEEKSSIANIAKTDFLWKEQGESVDWCSNGFKSQTSDHRLNLQQTVPPPLTQNILIIVMKKKDRKFETRVQVIQKVLPLTNQSHRKRITPN